MAGGTILIADDDSAIRTVLNQAFARAGYAPRATGNAATLWRWVAQGEGDVVITDVVMPDENAFDLIPRIKKLRPDLPIIVMSAQNTLMTALTAAEKGAFEYLPKPFDLNQIVSIVGRALAEPGRRKERGVPESDIEELPLARHAGDLPCAGAADTHGPDRDDHRRIGHRQGAGRARAARLCQAPQRPVCRHQHGRDPARADRERAFWSRERRVYRRSGAHRRALPAGRRRYALPRRDRRHANGGPDAFAACAAGGRIYDGRRPHADQNRCAHHRRNPPGAQDPSPAGPLPRGSLLPAQRRAAQNPAAQGASGGYRRPGAPLPAPSGKGRPRPQVDRDGGHRTPQALPLARQRPRTGEHGAPARRAASGGHSDGRHRRGGAGRGRAAAGRRRRQDAQGSFRANRALSGRALRQLRARVAAAGALRP